MCVLWVCVVLWVVCVVLWVCVVFVVCVGCLYCACFVCVFVLRVYVVCACVRE